MKTAGASDREFVVEPRRRPSPFSALERPGVRHEEDPLDRLAAVAAVTILPTTRSQRLRRWRDLLLREGDRAAPCCLEFRDRTTAPSAAPTTRPWRLPSPIRPCARRGSRATPWRCRGLLRPQRPADPLPALRLPLPRRHASGPGRPSDRRHGPRQPPGEGLVVPHGGVSAYCGRAGTPLALPGLRGMVRVAKTGAQAGAPSAQLPSCCTATFRPFAIARARWAHDARGRHAAALALPGATFDIIGGADRVYSVGGKMFAHAGVEGDPKAQVHVQDLGLLAFEC